MARNIGAAEAVQQAQPDRGGPGGRAEFGAGHQLHGVAQPAAQEQAARPVRQCKLEGGAQGPRRVVMAARDGRRQHLRFPQQRRRGSARGCEGAQASGAQHGGRSACGAAQNVRQPHGRVLHRPQQRLLAQREQQVAAADRLDELQAGRVGAGAATHRRSAAVPHPIRAQHIQRGVARRLHPAEHHPGRGGMGQRLGRTGIPGAQPRKPDAGVGEPGIRRQAERGATEAQQEAEQPLAGGRVQLVGQVERVGAGRRGAEFQGSAGAEQRGPLRLGRQPHGGDAERPGRAVDGNRAIGRLDAGRPGHRADCPMRHGHQHHVIRQQGRPRRQDVVRQVAKQHRRSSRGWRAEGGRKECRGRPPGGAAPGGRWPDGQWTVK